MEKLILGVFALEVLTLEMVILGMLGSGMLVLVLVVSLNTWEYTCNYLEILELKQYSSVLEIGLGAS